MRKFIEESKASINKNDLELFFNLVGNFNPTNILEIGTWRGYSAEVWIKGFKPKALITLEKDPEQEESFNVCIERGYQSWYETNSQDPEVLETLKIYLPTIDFLFIDGDHSYEGVKKDWELYKNLLAPHAIVLFHDVCYTSDDPNAPVQVKRLWHEIRDGYNWAEIRSQGSTGIGILFT